MPLSRAQTHSVRHDYQLEYGIMQCALNMIIFCKCKALTKTKPSHPLRDKLEKLKASIRAKVEHTFRVIKCQFGHRKARYRGLAKNTSQLLVIFPLSNLWMVRKRIM
jgi:IS5 family transposase